ncbi:hypothetical protein LEMLEM_LOCUS1814 [Lemmus lemmus]
MYQAQEKRIPEDCHGHSHRICYHGSHWLVKLIT